MDLKNQIKRTPLIGPLAVWLKHKIQPPAEFSRSDQYWRDRYRQGGNSGAGSYSKFAEFKAKVLNDLVRDNGIRSVIEFGSGDGNQLTLAKYPTYLGVDVSSDAVALCRKTFSSDASKSFIVLEDYEGTRAELALSLDVIYHLVEDNVFDSYMQRLFDSAERWVTIYSSNTDDQMGNSSTHVRHRRFSDWIEKNAPEWKLKLHIANPYPYYGNSAEGSFADFYIFVR